MRPRFCGRCREDELFQESMLLFLRIDHNGGNLCDAVAHAVEHRSAEQHEGMPI